MTPRSGSWGARLARGAAAGLATIAAATGARAADDAAEPVRFAWVRGQGAEACPVADRVKEEVAARFGRDPFTTSPSARSVDVIVTRAGGTWRAEIDVRASDGTSAGTREITSDAPGCGALASATVLALALAIDPLAGLAPPKPPPSKPAPEGFTRPEAAPIAPPPPPREVAPPPDRPPALGATSLAAHVGVAVGLLPRAAATVGVSALAALGDRFSLGAVARFAPEVRASDPRFAFGLTAVGLVGCGRLVGRDPADLALCAAAAVGALHAVVDSIEPLAAGDRAWAALSAAPRARLRLGSRVHLEAGAEVVVPLTRRSFSLEGRADAPVFAQAAVGALPWVGVGASFE